LLRHPLNSGCDWLPHVACEHRNIERRQRRGKFEGAEFEVKIGDHEKPHELTLNLRVVLFAQAVEQLHYRRRHRRSGPLRQKPGA
jgi:hypothetical protein